MKRLKTAYEIALERANSLDSEQSAEEKALFQREKLRPLLADFYRAKIGPEQLWEELQKKDEPELYEQAQLLLLESIGLQTSADELQRRKEAILAVESLRGGANSLPSSNGLLKKSLKYRKTTGKAGRIQEFL